MLKNWLNKSVEIAPLVTFRILFGALMLFSTLRFWSLGWIEKHYIQPLFHFRYFGFEWVPVGPDWFIYLAHIAMIAGAIGITFGAWYRISAVVFFLSFTYTELIDLTYYLNHYYFVSLVALVLIFLPANAMFSVDAFRGKVRVSESVPRWTIDLLKFQIGTVYFFAGIAKINSDWLIEAMPMRIWLPANDTLPLIGSLVSIPEMAWVFSWAGMIFDISIPFLLLWKRSRIFAYLAVVVFHTVTGMMFQIGVFPKVMILLTPIFFDAKWHKRAVGYLSGICSYIGVKMLTLSASVNGLEKRPPFIEALEINGPRAQTPLASDKSIPLEETNNLGETHPNFWFKAFISRTSMNLVDFNLNFFGTIAILVIVGFQVLFPFRYLAYPGELFWTEQGYRFSWRVMLIEKSGSTTFYVKDGENGREGMVDNSEFLNRHQEKQMSFQPDMMLQFAHFLEEHFLSQGMIDPIIRAEAWVTINGRPSRLLIDPTLDLTTVSDSWTHKSWILPIDNNVEPPQPSLMAQSEVHD